MSKKEIERLRLGVDANETDSIINRWLIYGIIIVCTAFLIVLTISASQGEWQCTQWEDVPDYDNCKQVTYWNPNDEWTELTCKNKKVCTQEMLIREVIN